MNTSQIQWAEEEKEFALANYDSMPHDELASKINKSVGAMKTMVSRLKTKDKPKPIDRDSLDEMIEYLQREPEDVVQFIKDLDYNLGKAQRYVRILEHIQNALINNKLNVIVEFLGVERDEVKGEAQIRSWKKWTEADEEYLRDNYGKITNKEMGLVMDRSASAIGYKLSIMGLSKKE